MDSTWLWVIPISGILGLAFVVYLVRDVLSRDEGTKEMKAVADTIYEGAIAFIRRQYATIAALAIVVAIIIAVLVSTEQITETPVKGFNLGLMTGIAFLVGAAASALSGIIGMYVAVRSNVRVASAARSGVAQALNVALRGGAVSGFLVVGLSLIGVAVMFWLYGGLEQPQIARLMWAQTSWAKWKPEFPKMTRATRQLSRFWSAIMWATAMVVARTCSSPPSRKISAR
jgi:K(+)-stimulated pyrophosphate-energized sodium pump